jgi:hypothetical protein
LVLVHGVLVVVEVRGVVAVDLGTRQVAAAENLKFAPIFPIFPSAENHHADRRKPHWSLFANFLQMLQLFASWVLRESLTYANCVNL